MYSIFPFKKVPPNSRVVLYSGCLTSKNYLRQMLETDYCKIVAVVTKHQEETNIGAADVVPLSRLEDLAYDYILVTPQTESFRNEIKAELLERGIGEKKIILCDEKMIQWEEPGVGFRESYGRMSKEMQLANYAFFDMTPHLIKRLGIYANASKIVEVPVKDFLLMQYSEMNPERFESYDIAVRCLALEQQTENNSLWASILHRFWEQDNQEIESAAHWAKDPAAEQKIVDAETVVETNRDMRLLDGGQAVSTALLENKEFIRCRLNNTDFTLPRNMEWFWGNGFTAEQCREICRRGDELIRCANYPFVAVLWSPACKLFDQITDELDLLWADNISVEGYTDLLLEKEEYDQFIKMVYFSDDVNDANLSFKIKANFRASNNENNEYPVRIVRLNIRRPYYKLKSVSGLPLSCAAVDCKETIRRRYMSEISDYQRDVIIHVADNYLQSKFILTALSIDQNISELFQKLDNCGCVIIKESEKQGSLFPNRFIFNTEVDVLARPDRFSQACALAFNYFLEHFQEDWIKIQNKNGVISAVMRGFCIFTLHIQTTTALCSPAFLDECISNREPKCFCGNWLNVLPERYEVIIRIGEYLRFSHKTHHYRYVMEHKDQLETELLEKAFVASQIKKIKELFNC